MPDARLDAITSAIANLQTDWGVLVVAAKTSVDPRDCVEILTAGQANINAQVTAITSSILALPIDDIAIDTHSGLT